MPVKADPQAQAAIARCIAKADPPAEAAIARCQCLQVYVFVRIFTDLYLSVRLYGFNYKITDLCGIS